MRVSGLVSRLFAQATQVSTLFVSSDRGEWPHGSLLLSEAGLYLIKQVT